MLKERAAPGRAYDLRRVLLLVGRPGYRTARILRKLDDNFDTVTSPRRAEATRIEMYPASGRDRGHDGGDPVVEPETRV